MVRMCNILPACWFAVQPGCIVRVLKVQGPDYERLPMVIPSTISGTCDHDKAPIFCPICPVPNLFGLLKRRTVSEDHRYPRLIAGYRLGQRKKLLHADNMLI